MIKNSPGILTLEAVGSSSQSCCGCAAQLYLWFATLPSRKSLYRWCSCTANIWRSLGLLWKGDKRKWGRKFSLSWIYPYQSSVQYKQVQDPPRWEFHQKKMGLVVRGKHSVIYSAGRCTGLRWNSPSEFKLLQGTQITKLRKTFLCCIKHPSFIKVIYFCAFNFLNCKPGC